MSEKITQIVEELKTLTLLEASELVTAIEETFGVDASSSIGGSVVMSTIPSTSEEIEEKTELHFEIWKGYDKQDPSLWLYKAD